MSLSLFLSFLSLPPHPRVPHQRPCGCFPSGIILGELVSTGEGDPNQRDRAGLEDHKSPPPATPDLWWFYPAPSPFPPGHDRHPLSIRIPGPLSLSSCPLYGREGSIIPPCLLSLAPSPSLPVNLFYFCSVLALVPCRRVDNFDSI